MANPHIEERKQQVLEPTAKSHRLLSPTDDNVSPQPFLPDELIEKILLRLPVKYLLQLQFVCKLWKTLISDSQFTMKHLLCSTSDQSMNHKRLAFCYRTYPEKFVSCPLNSLFENPSTPVELYSFSGLKREYDIIGSCNGLLCLYDIDQYSVILYNHSIRLKSKKSPSVTSLDQCIRANGFGYDQVNDKYKVLLVLDNMNPNKILTKIYTFGDDSWRTIPNFPCTTVTLEGKYVSGTLNWIGFKRLVGSRQYMILSFDMENETYQEVLLPQNVGDDYKCRPLPYVLSNCLCVCFVNQTHLVVWLMKEYGVVESWTKLTIIPLDKFISNPFIDMLFISENGVVLMTTYSPQLILYNINSGGLDYPSISSKRVFDLHIYHESLISPHRC